MDSYARITELVQLRGPATQALMIGALVLMRCAPIMFQAPFLGGKLVPPNTRLGLSLGLAVLVYPYAILSVQTTDLGALAFLVLLAKELFLGFVIGFVSSLIFHAVEFGGRALDTMRGSSMAEVQVPELKTRASPIGQFNFQLLLVVFCVLNGHGVFIEAVIKSFELVPVDQFPAMTRGFGELIEQLLRYISGLFGVAFALVFPGIFASFLVDVVFGMFNRIAPQLNAYFMALGVKSMAGVAMLLFSLSLMMGQMGFELERSLLFLRQLMGFWG